uniref:tRNA-binding domain-containing protein n=2 Tax=Ornithorhynchus anatinus TaxID=9258 RepID=A0A6I8P8Y0_ORNAN
MHAQRGRLHVQTGARAGSLDARTRARPGGLHARRRCTRRQVWTHGHVHMPRGARAGRFARTDRQVARRGRRPPGHAHVQAGARAGRLATRPGRCTRRRVARRGRRPPGHAHVQSGARAGREAAGPGRLQAQGGAGADGLAGGAGARPEGRRRMRPGCRPPHPPPPGAPWGPPFRLRHRRAPPAAEGPRRGPPPPPPPRPSGPSGPRAAAGRGGGAPGARRAPGRTAGRRRAAQRAGAAAAAARAGAAGGGPEGAFVAGVARGRGLLPPPRPGPAGDLVQCRDTVTTTEMNVIRFFSQSLGKMATNNTVLNRLEQKGAEADQVIEFLKQQVALLKEKAILQASLREEKKLRVENAKLKKEIEGLKQELIQAEIRNGVKQIPVPSAASLQADSSALFSEDLAQPTPVPATPGAARDQVKGGGEEKKKKEKLDKKGEKKEKKPQPPAAAGNDSKPVDVSRLDLRVGCVLSAQKHPDADSLYVEEVDVGEPAPRTVVSGLVKHVPLDQMQKRMVILLCNLKPAKMRGVVSQAMVMCASSPEKVEILAPPPGSVPGERITFDGFPGEPEKELNPKKKIWEQIQPDLLTNDQCVATYKGVPFEVKGKGVCKAQTMANSGIK